MLWSTFLGGPNYERVYAIEVDGNGDVYVAGRAGPGFPTTSGALQQSFGGDNNPNSAYGEQDGFVAKLAADGGSLIWSTYFGGAGRGFIRDIDIDTQGRVHIAFVSFDQNPHITGNADRGNRLGGTDAGYAILSANGQSVSYATYLGGTTGGGRFATIPFVALANDGGAYVAHIENASDVPTSANAFQPALAGAIDIVVSRIQPSGNVAWATYLGGSGIDEMETHALTVDANNRPVIVGLTFSKDFPVTNNAFQTSAGSGNTSDEDGFVSILSENGDSLFASSYLGGSSSDHLEGVTRLSDGTIAVTGGTHSSFLPVDGASHQTFNAGGMDGMLVQFSSDLTSVLYASYFGGSGNDSLTDVKSGPQDVLAFAGFTESSDFPTVNAFDMSIQGQVGAVYGRLEPN